MLSVAQRAVQGEFATLGVLRAAVREQAKQIKLALSREAVQLASKECALVRQSIDFRCQCRQSGFNVCICRHNLEASWTTPSGRMHVW